MMTDKVGDTNGTLVTNSFLGCLTKIRMELYQNKNLSMNLKGTTGVILYN